MPWNWELPGWPHFECDFERIAPLERQFLLGVGQSAAYLKTIDAEERRRFVVEILSEEGVQSSKIEGEILDRGSLQSSIQRHFGLALGRAGSDKEEGMARLLCSVYETFDAQLTHKMLGEWHAMLFGHGSRVEERGRYRTHAEPMQIVSHRYGDVRVFFEAPPSKRVFEEMDRFIQWFNTTPSSAPILGCAAIAHVYFESIHPFEDGNGRIGRALVEKMLSQRLGQPTLISLSKMLEKRKKEYYAALEVCNRALQIDAWALFFASAIVQAHEESMQLLAFLIEKSKMLQNLAGRINPRQMKVLLRMFAEGPSGFRGDMSAEKYIAITKTSRATATRDLADLVEKGALIKTGTRRHTRYQLNLQSLKSSPK